MEKALSQIATGLKKGAPAHESAFKVDN